LRVLAAVAGVLPNVAGFSTIGNFPNDSGGLLLLTSMMFTIVPVAAVISHVNNVPVVVGFSACCYRLHNSTFTSIYAFAGVVSTVVAVLRLLVFLLLLAFLLLWAVIIARIPGVVDLPAVAFVLAVAFVCCWRHCCC